MLPNVTRGIRPIEVYSATVSTPDLSAVIAEAIEWAEGRARLEDPVACLRSPELRPTGFRAARDYRDRTRILDIVVRQRSELVRRPGKPLRPPTPESMPGRILLYLPDEQLSDGAAQAATWGFLDAENAPPWDTWVAYLRNPIDERPWGGSWFLAAWIPPIFVEWVQAGCYVNPEQCIGWASIAPDWTVSIDADAWERDRHAPMSHLLGARNEHEWRILAERSAPFEHY